MLIALAQTSQYSMYIWNERSHMEKTHNNDDGMKTKDLCDERTKQIHTKMYNERTIERSKTTTKNHSQIDEIEFGILLYETSVTE